MATGNPSDEGENSGIIPAPTGISEFEQLLKQGTVNRFNVQHLTTMEDLPDEILTNIFIRLLAKQLGQMRSISKSWNALLSQSSFIKSHLHHSIHNNNNQQIILAFSICYKTRFTQYLCKSPHFEPIDFIKHPPTNLQMMVIGAVNGLICLSEYFSSNIIYIWNPSLSAMSVIPPSHSLSAVPPHFTPPTIYQVKTSTRFGFDPKTDDYKLVNISGIRSKNDYFSVKEWLPVEVYSMRKRCWEFITQPFPSHITKIYNYDDLCVDGHHGHLHWQTISDSQRERRIVAFDVGSETFQEIPLPDSILDSNHITHTLRILDGKVCDLSWRMDGGWEVWVMEEYGVPESWVRRHVLSQFTSGWRFSYGFTSRSELLLNDKDGRLILYDPITNNTKSTHTRESAYKFVEYNDSLIWI